MLIEELLGRYRALGCEAVYAKPLAENDNSKQQIYLGSGFDAITLLPFGAVRPNASAKIQTFKASVKLLWMSESGQTDRAPGAQLILYPSYPEVRLSGFVRGSKYAPSESLRPIARSQRRKNNQPDGRVLFFGVSGDAVYCYLAPAQSELSSNFNVTAPTLPVEGVFYRVDLPRLDTRRRLLEVLSTICGQRAFASRRMLSDGTCVAYSAQNGGGYTLEALLNVTPNGRSLPDYLDWEIKAHRTTKITLMTPEPDGGEYARLGAAQFLARYRTSLRTDTLRFASVHRYGVVNSRTKFRLELRGFNVVKGKITDVGGGLELISNTGNCVASWSFAKLIEHWGQKHASVAFIRYKKLDLNGIYYEFLPQIKLGMGAKFELFLLALSRGEIVYDPGLSGTIEGSTKARNQFRTSERYLQSLYESFEQLEIKPSMVSSASQEIP